MVDFDTKILQDQQAIIVVASTFGDGEAPNNGEEFKKNLIKMHKENFKFRHINNELPWYAYILGYKIYKAYYFFKCYKFKENFLFFLYLVFPFWVWDRHHITNIARSGNLST